MERYARCSRRALDRSLSGRRAGEAPALCARAAERVRAEGPRGAFAGARAVEVRTDVYDVLSYYETRTPTRPGVVHARCPL